MGLLEKMGLELPEQDRTPPDSLLPVGHPDNPYPVPYHPTFEILDSSKIQKLQGCPSGFFYSYILGFRRPEPNIHLGFGTAWHEAMEYLHIHGLHEDNVVPAWKRFLSSFNKEMGTINVDHYAKNPDNALEALHTYVQQYGNETKWRTLYTEIAGAVPIDHDRLIHVKMDTIIEDTTSGLIYSLEHKTTGRNSTSWQNQWEVKFQIGTYYYALECLFPGRVGGVIVNGAVLRKKNNEFLRLPQRRSDPQVQQWMLTARHYYDYYQWNMEALKQQTREQDAKSCFNINGQFCSVSWHGCSFPGLCTMWPNPLDQLDENGYIPPPPGYIYNFWDPRRNEEEAKTLLVPGGATGDVELKVKEETETS